MKKTLLFFLFFSLLSLQSQGNNSMFWKDTVENIAPQEVQTILWVEGDIYKELPKEEGKKLWVLLSSMTALSHPECRCLPEIQGRLFFFFVDNRAFMLEIAVDHWVQGIYMNQGKSMSFYLKDQTNQVVAALRNILVNKSEIQPEIEPELKPTPEEIAPISETEPIQDVEKTPQEPETVPQKPIEEQPTMCNECQNQMFAMMMGECQKCQNPTASISFKYCDQREKILQSSGKQLRQ